VRRALLLGDVAAAGYVVRVGFQSGGAVRRVAVLRVPVLKEWRKRGEREGAKKEKDRRRRAKRAKREKGESRERVRKHARARSKK